MLYYVILCYIIILYYGAIAAGGKDGEGDEETPISGTRNELRHLKAKIEATESRRETKRLHLSPQTVICILKTRFSHKPSSCFDGR